MDTEPKSSKKHKKHRDKDRVTAADGERVSKKARKKQKLEQAKTALETMSTEQRAELYRAIKTAKLMRKKVKVHGKKVRLDNPQKRVNVGLRNHFAYFTACHYGAHFLRAAVCMLP